MNITFYTAPAPFDGAEGVRQSLAIHSWLRLDSRPHVVLMGRHPSLQAFAQTLQPRVSVDSDIDITYVSFSLFYRITFLIKLQKLEWRFIVIAAQLLPYLNE